MKSRQLLAPVYRVSVLFGATCGHGPSIKYYSLRLKLGDFLLVCEQLFARGHASSSAAKPSHLVQHKQFLLHSLMLHSPQRPDNVDAITTIHSLTQDCNLLLDLILGGGPFDDLLEHDAAGARNRCPARWTIIIIINIRVDLARICLLQNCDARLLWNSGDELFGNSLQQRRLSRPVLANKGISLAGFEPEFRVREDFSAFG